VTRRCDPHHRQQLRATGFIIQQPQDVGQSIVAQGVAQHRHTSSSAVRGDRHLPFSGCPLYFETGALQNISTQLQQAFITVQSPKRCRQNSYE
jgi:hypothetical protein